MILFGGKGGVGKTSCAAAAALFRADRHPGDRILLVSTDPAHSLMDSFAGTLPPRNLELREFDAAAHLTAFRAKHGGTLAEIARRGTFLSDEDIGGFINLSIPGIDELFALLEITGWLQEENGFKTILVDTAPTGHTLRLLGMPEFLRRWLSALDALLAKHRYMKRLFQGYYRKDDLDHFLEELSASVERTEALLRNGRECHFVPVMNLEMPVFDETERLLRTLRRGHIAAGELLINRFAAEAGYAACTAGRGEQARVLEESLRRFKRYRLWAVPLHAEEVRGAERLRAFWRGLRRVSAPLLKTAPVGLETQVLNPAPAACADRELLLFAGKGGVGKTTLASATALRLAQRSPGVPTLLVSTDPAHSLSDCLAMPVGAQPVEVAPGLMALEIDAEAEFASLKREYEAELHRFFGELLGGMDLAFDREVMENLLELAPPGLDEVMALMQAIDYLEEGGPRRLIVDTAPTGHLLRLLELPGIVDQWLKAIFELFLKYRDVFRFPGFSRRLVALSKQLKRFRALLGDPGRAALVAVSILTEMALEETADLVSACGRMRVFAPILFLNMASRESDYPVCAAVHRREEGVLGKYRKRFPQNHQTIIARQEPPIGLERLEALGGAMYSEAARRAACE